MSLTHGHFYAAEKILEKMNDPLKSIVTKHIKEYRLGAVGHDLVGWSDTFTFLNFGDLHSSQASKLVEKLLDVAIGNYIAGVALGDHITENENGEPFLAFALGWVAHWATDLYIHSLVDKYGGNYIKSPSRHAQLELVETKYIHELYTQQCRSTSGSDTWTLKNNNKIWGIMAEALCATYTKDGIHYEKGKDLDKIGKLTYRNLVGYIAMAGAFDAANQGCTSKNEDTLFPWELAKLLSDFSPSPPFILNPRQIPADGAIVAWASKDAYIPSDNTYQTLIKPLKITVIPTATYLDVRVEIKDTGLYGKFLADYEPFIKAAIDKASHIVGITNEYLTESAKDFTKESEAKNNYYSKLQVIIYTTDKRNMDILVTEPHWPMLTSDNPYIDDVLSTPPAYSDTKRKDLYYELELNLGGQVLPVVIDREIVNPYEKEKNRIHDSYRVVTGFIIPIENPQSLPYAYKLKISLTDKQAFTYPQHENIEYQYLEAVYIDIAFIKNCTSIEVGYYGPIRRDEIIEGKVVRSKDRCILREYSQYPALTVIAMAAAAHLQTPTTEYPRSSFVVDNDKDGKDGQKVDLYWEGCNFTATINAKGNNETGTVAMPGCPETEVKPVVCGNWSNTISIKGKVDFEKQTVTFQAVEKRHDERKDEFNDYKADFTRTFSAENLHLIDCDEDGSMACFGVGHPTAMKASAACYECIDTCTGKPYYGKARNIQDTIDLEGDKNDDDRCLYIKFCK